MSQRSGPRASGAIRLLLLALVIEAALLVGWLL